MNLKYLPVQFCNSLFYCESRENNSPTRTSATAVPCICLVAMTTHFSTFALFHSPSPPISPPLGVHCVEGPDEVVCVQRHRSVLDNLPSSVLSLQPALRAVLPPLSSRLPHDVVWRRICEWLRGCRGCSLN